MHALVLALCNILLTSRYEDALQWYANGLGLGATALAIVQFLPQIYTTYTLKSVGSLSLLTMCIQTPGSYVWAASLAARLGWAGWSIWGLFCVTGTLQGIILTLGIIYELRERRERREAEILADPEGVAQDGGAVERGHVGHLADQNDQDDDIRDESTPLISAR